MYIELNTKSKSLGGLSDLTVLAPIKKGFAPSLESITYKTRVKRLLEALQLLRESSHEYSIFRSISDSAERVARIHSFRVAVIEPEDQLLLAVTFDGARDIEHPVPLSKQKPVLQPYGRPRGVLGPG